MTVVREVLFIRSQSRISYCSLCRGINIQSGQQLSICPGEMFSLSIYCCALIFFLSLAHMVSSGLSFLPLWSYELLNEIPPAAVFTSEIIMQPTWLPSLHLAPSQISSSAHCLRHLEPDLIKVALSIPCSLLRLRKWAVHVCVSQSCC